MEKIYYTMEILVARLLITLIENKGCRKITYKEIGKYNEILVEEAENMGIELRVTREIDNDLRSLIIKESDGILLRGSPSFLVYHYGIYMEPDFISLFESENVVNRTLEMMNCKKPDEKYEINAEDDIKWLNERIEEKIKQRNFSACVEYQKEIDELEYIKNKISKAKEKNKVFMKNNTLKQD